MTKINTKRLKANLSYSDYQKILKALGIPFYSQGKNYDTLYTACHNKNPYDGSPKLLFYKDKGIFQCLTECSCSMDIIGLAQKRLALIGKPSSFMDAINFILNVTGKELEDVKRISKPNVIDWESGLEKFIKFKRGETILPEYNKAILNQLSNIFSGEWIDEGISIETMKKYRIGYYEPSQCTTIPCFDRDGKLVGIRARYWVPEDIENGKYRPLSLLNGKTYKFPTNNVFYGINFNWPEIERTKTAILVESEKAVMKLDTWFKNNNVALGMFGHNLGIYRRNQLIQMGVNHVIYVPDNDWINKSDEDFDTWQKAAIQLCEQFKGMATVEMVWDNQGLLGPKDNATDYDKDTWDKLYESRILIC